MAVGGLPRAGETEFLSAVRGAADVPIQPFLGADASQPPSNGPVTIWEKPWKRGLPRLPRAFTTKLSQEGPEKND